MLKLKSTGRLMLFMLVMCNAYDSHAVPLVAKVNPGRKLFAAKRMNLWLRLVCC